MRLAGSVFGQFSPNAGQHKEDAVKVYITARFLSTRSVAAKLIFAKKGTGRPVPVTRVREESHEKIRHVRAVPARIYRIPLKCVEIMSVCVQNI